MFAKQTLWWSASLGVALGGSAYADPGGEGRGYFELGAGLATDDGFIVNAAIDQPDLFHTGNELGMFATMSSRLQRFDTRFVDPHVLDGTLRLDLYSEWRQLPGFERKAVGFTAKQSYQLTPHLTAWVGVKLENVSIDGVTPLARGAPTEYVPAAAGNIVALQAGLAYSTVDLQMRHGSTFGIYAEQADPRLGSTYGFGKLGGWAATHQPIGPFTLHAGGSITALTAGTPMSERLFLDGASDVRGFAPGAFGPLGGGTFKAVGHVSLELPVSQSVSLEGFLDAARISNNDFTSPIGTAHASGVSYGFGAIWHSPIGPLHVDLAYPLGDAPGLFFSFGGMPAP